MEYKEKDVYNEDIKINLYNLSPSLIKYLNPESQINSNLVTDWEPPKRHGLNNSFIIIPQYYMTSNEKILKVDYYEMILDDIRNCRKLNEHQLNFIKNLDDESKQKNIS
jgi:hypothetical protein